MFVIIAAIGKNRELGKDGKLLWRLPEDMKFFKETTMGHAVLMGRKTWESLPSGALPGRKNYVVTREKAIADDQVALINNLSEFVSAHASDEEKIFVIGGGMVYWEMMKYADELILTEVDAEDKTADTFFPEFDKNEWEKEVIGGSDRAPLKFEFVRYKRRKNG